MCQGRVARAKWRGSDGRTVPLWQISAHSNDCARQSDRRSPPARISLPARLRHGEGPLVTRGPYIVRNDATAGQLDFFCACLRLEETFREGTRIQSAVAAPKVSAKYGTTASCMHVTGADAN